MKILLVNQKITVILLTIALLLIGLPDIGYSEDADQTVVQFSDRTLAIMVRISIAIDSSKPPNLIELKAMPEAEVLKISKAELAKLTHIGAGKKAANDLRLPLITDLTGLEYATQLRSLDLRGQDVTDLTPLAQLTQLTSLDLWGNKIIDISLLAQLTQLRDLDLGGGFRSNEIVDISPLAELTQLRSLGLGGNEISDITTLAQLTELSELSLSFNRISNISPLAGLTELTRLWLDGNQISDINPLSQLTKLTMLGLTANQISDISPLAQLKKLTFLQLGYNQIRDITPLRQAESLEELHLDHNQIRDLSPLATLTRLTRLDLANNQISDLTPLVQLSESLEELNLEDNQIRDVTPLAQLIYLRELKLRDNPIADTFPLSPLLDENPDLRIDIEVVREERGPTVTVSTPQPLTAATLNGSIVILTLSSGEFELRGKIRDAVTISGVTGITFDWTDIERVSDTEARIELTFDGTIDADTTLTVTVGSGAIRNYNGPAQTAEIPVSADAEQVLTEASTTNAVVSISPASVASPAIGDELTLNLNIADGEAVAGYQASVQFDTTALRFVSGVNGDFLPAGAFFVQPVVEGNLVKFNAASLGGESSGNGTLAILTFEVITVKESTLTLSDVLLTNSAGAVFVPQLENAQVTEPTKLKGDINGDGIVNIQDLVLVAGRLGQTGTNAADVNRDGIVNIQDLVLVAGALGNSAAAPSLISQSLEIFTAADIQLWLSQAQQLALIDATSQRGVLFLEQLLAALIPTETVLLPNYPNPFNPETWIPYRLATDAFVTLTIYDQSGQVVRTLDVGYQSASTYESQAKAAYWDGRNEFGETVASGVYFYTLTADDFSATRKMLILK